jgi:hypothetical protein
VYPLHIEQLKTLQNQDEIWISNKFSTDLHQTHAQLNTVGSLRKVLRTAIQLLRTSHASFTGFHTKANSQQKLRTNSRILTFVKIREPGILSSMEALIIKMWTLNSSETWHPIWTRLENIDGSVAILSFRQGKSPYMVYSLSTVILKLG